jgi:hypothetical protein
VPEVVGVGDECGVLAVNVDKEDEGGGVLAGALIVGVAWVGAVWVGAVTVGIVGARDKLNWAVSSGYWNPTEPKF